MRTLRKRRRNQGIGAKLKNGGDLRAMPVEKNARKFRVMSSMAEEKTLERIEEEDLPFFFSFISIFC